MNPRHLELADEFCTLVGSPHLVEYLGLEPGATSEESRSSLKKRRKYMQGMQSNPKYKAEALFLIKNFAALDAVLVEPAAYLDAVRRQQESTHLPILEMTIRTVLKGGTLSAEQEEYLLRQALELGLAATTFEDTLDRLAAQAGVARPRDGIAGVQPEHEEDALPNENVEFTDHYGILGLPTSASRDAVYEAYKNRYRAVRALADRERAEKLYKRLDRAWQVLSDNTSRETYDLSLKQTGPPASRRSDDDPFLDSLRLAPTAPPVKSRAQGPNDVISKGTPAPTVSPGRGRIEFAGPRVRQVRLSKSAFEATLPVRIAEGLEAVVSTDEPWLQAQPARLPAGQRDQVITVRVEPGDLPRRSATAVVTVQTDQGDRASLVFEVRRSFPVLPALAGTLAAGGVLAGALAAASSLGWFEPPDRSVTLSLDPTAEEVLIDGVSLGGGPRVVVREAPSSPVTLTVLHPNFETWAREVDLSVHHGGVFTVELTRSASLSFRPSDDQVQGTVSEDALMTVMPPRMAAMDACVRSSGAPPPLAGSVRIFVDRTGVAVGAEVEGTGAETQDVLECLLRQAAAVRLPPVVDGDYATVRYDYEVAEGAP